MARAVITDKPTLKELQCFQLTDCSGRRKSIGIIEETASSWRKIGTALKFEDYQLQNIACDCRPVEERCHRVLQEWLKGRPNSNDPLTWESLLQANMAQAGCTGVAKLVWKELTGEDMLIPDHPQTMFTKQYMPWLIILGIIISSILIYNFLVSGPMVEYRRYLKDYYSNYYPLYSKPVFATKSNRPEQPIDLVLFLKERNECDASIIQHQMFLSNGTVSEIEKLKVPVKLNEIGSLNEGRTAAKFVLIEGGPGMGKSTLCWQLCRLWREGKLQWDLMVIVELRKLITRNVSNLYDLLYHPDDKIRLAIEQDIQKREGEGLLMFLDGYDEISKIQRSEISVIIYKILTNELLRKATVVVTSQPHAIKSLPSEFQDNLDQHIEIAGFNKTSIETYIQACVDNQNLSQALLSYVNSHPFILSVMYNPLHCSIITELYKQYWVNNQKAFAPETLTELYYALVLDILKRRMPTTQKSSTIKSLSGLPKWMNDGLMQLAELAAEGLEEGNYVFNDICLMMSSEILGDIRAKQQTSFTFLHLTLQEYLAAYYWSQHPDQQPVEFLESQIRNCMINDRVKNRPFCLFYAGLSKNKTHLRHANLTANNLGHFHIPQICELLFEANSSELYFANINVELVPHENCSSRLLKNPLNSHTIAYCFIRNSDNTTTWNLKVKDQKYIQRWADGMHSIHGRTEWDERYGPSIRLHLTENVNEILGLFTRLYPFTKSITSLVLSEDLNDEGIAILKDLNYYCPKLTSLLLTRNSSKPSLVKTFHLPRELNLTRVTVHLPDEDELLNSLHHYQPVTELHIEKSCGCPDFCRSLSLIVPKIREHLLKIKLISQNATICDQCVRDIAQLMRKVVVMYTPSTHNYYKYLEFYDGFNQALIKSLTTVSSKDWNQVLISGDAIDCDAAKILIKKMPGEMILDQKLALYVDQSCTEPIEHSKGTCFCSTNARVYYLRVCHSQYDLLDSNGNFLFHMRSDDLSLLNIIKRQ